MKKNNTAFPFRHLLLRLVLLPLLIGAFYLLLQLGDHYIPAHVSSLRIAVFAASALTALFLMGESIRLFGKSQYDKLICNLATVLCIIFFIVFTIQLL